MTICTTPEHTEAFQPLGAPIRPEAPKPAASPAVVTPGIIRHADGTLGTAIPPPSAPAPVVRAMRERDTVRPQAYIVDESIADYFSRQCRKLLAPTDPAAWPAYSKDYEAGYRAGYAAAMQQSSRAALAETQAADWLTITKQVQDMPSKP